MNEGLANVLSSTQALRVTSRAYARPKTHNHHHVAIVTSCKTGTVLASATNEPTPTGSVHAEIGALRQFQKRLRDRTFHSREVCRGVCVTSVRLNRSNQLLLAKPCTPCTLALSKCALVRRVVWSNEHGDIVDG